MSNNTNYVIRGGLAGRERLRVLSRVMHPTTMALFDRLDVRSGLSCLDVGCGGGDVSLALARRVAPGGKVVGLDIDDEKLSIARLEAEQQGIENVEFRAVDIRHAAAAPLFDIVYARFLLTHLSEPVSVLGAFFQHLRPGGVAIVEDVDFSGHFTYPDSQAFRRYHELYCATVIRRGGDPNIGPRLPTLLRQAGFTDVGVGLVQPIAIQGEAKLLSPLTMENIVDAVLADGLASQQEIDEVIRDLYAFAAAPDTLAGTPRIIQAWGSRGVL